MAGFSDIPRAEKRRIASELHDNLVARAAASPPDPLLDPMIAQLASSRDALADQVDGKTTAETSRTALLAQTDIDDDSVDRWYRHIYRFTEVEALRRHLPEGASIDALLSAGYPDGLSHVDDRIPDQNEEVKKTLLVYRDAKYADTLKVMDFSAIWLDYLEAAVQKSEASFAAYQATFGDASTAVSLGRDAEANWVVLMRALDNAISLRGLGAGAAVVEEGKRLMAPLTLAVRLLRSEEKTRATKRGKGKKEEGGG